MLYRVPQGEDAGSLCLVSWDSIQCAFSFADCTVTITVVSTNFMCDLRVIPAGPPRKSSKLGVMLGLPDTVSPQKQDAEILPVQ